MGLRERLRRLELKAERAEVPTPEAFLDAHQRTVARLHERWADEIGDPEGSLLSEEDYAILSEDTPERAETDRRVVEAWGEGIDLATEADAARARLLGGR